VNDFGAAAGFSLDASGNGAGGFIYSHGDFTPVSVPNSLATYPLALNDRNQMIGYDQESRLCPCSWGYASFFAWGGDDYRQYRYLLGWSNDINNQGQIVGSFFDQGFVATVPKFPGDR
jgi:hypothetical protein